MKEAYMFTFKITYFRRLLLETFNSDCMKNALAAYSGDTDPHSGDTDPPTFFLAYKELFRLTILPFFT
jgi:hypothetical protein